MTAALGDWSYLARQRLETYVVLLEKWNSAINLVSSASLSQVWQRHINDSTQLLQFAPPNTASWVDLGSGAGFPGMIVAILGADSGIRVTLIESDLRKCTFLSTVSRETGVPVTILPKRIEDISPLRADVVSARALAPLPQLCAYAARHLKPEGTALFLKGRQAKDEVALARKAWHFNLMSTQSQTDADATILQLKDLRHV
jgi:16S rRNA (guanine527-N7)-methyltransferase